MVQDQLVKLMSPSKRRAGRLRTGGRAVIPTVENRGLSVLQLNVEGLTTAKLEVLHHLADSNGAAVLLLQETHCTSDNILKIPGFHLAGSIYSKQHGVATFVRTEISWSASSQSQPGSNIEWLVKKIQETSVVNVYKPPPSELSTTSLPSITAPAIYAEFTAEELSEAMSKLKPGKSPGRDNIHPEFVIHQSTTTTGWLCAFYTSCYQRLKLPKTWRRTSVIALPKPNKSAEDPKSYRPISLLCVPFKILERMIHSCIEPVVDSQLPLEQAGFRRGRSTADQVTLLCQDIEDSFQDNEKAGVVYLDLTAAYDTVWLRGLHLKLLRTIPDRHMVKFIKETLSNRSFILQTSSGQCSRLRRLKNGVPQGSVLSPMLFNVYIHDLPDTASRKYGYADDLAIMLSRPMWKAMEEGLNEDMGTLVAYLRRWRQQLSVGKTVAAAYHLSTREARRELEVRIDNKCLEVQQAPKYLGVRLDRTLSFKKHLEEVKAKRNTAPQSGAEALMRERSMWLSIPPSK
ncbi:hypothetical protein JOQ06_007202 [Pogonophryne albipinna]|uniref:Reverse transcriptase domain-containing protein n=1 Tax=Pogonophryne albipinna TaxID=1090488 RepID=A0AAD6B0D8_9TELE|nr:hypothetical protein JOQ06_007202 [Pogonophryne albipinna]